MVGDDEARVWNNVRFERERPRKRIGSSNFQIIGLSKSGLGGPDPFDEYESKRTSSG